MFQFGDQMDIQSQSSHRLTAEYYRDLITTSTEFYNTLYYLAPRAWEYRLTSMCFFAVAADVFPMVPLNIPHGSLAMVGVRPEYCIQCGEDWSVTEQHEGDISGGDSPLNNHLGRFFEKLVLNNHVECAGAFLLRLKQKSTAEQIRSIISSNGPRWSAGSALHTAALYGHQTMLAVLLSLLPPDLTATKTSTVDDSDDTKATIITSQAAATALNSTFSPAGDSVLFYAINHIPVVRQLVLCHGADVNIKNRNPQGLTLLHRAARADATELVRTLTTELGANVNVMNGESKTPLQYALEHKPSLSAETTFFLTHPQQEIPKIKMTEKQPTVAR